MDKQTAKVDQLKFLEDIELKVSVSVGTVQKLFGEILKMKEGDVIQLDKHTEDYLDIHINGKTFAIGEMMIVNEKYSVRIIDLA
ncbi:MAG: flagellar motor switch protein FliN [Aquificae bacterium]|nr:flagellar motor switch protein FliN [Aquificota bacterium]